MKNGRRLAKTSRFFSEFKNKFQIQIILTMRKLVLLTGIFIMMFAITEANAQSAIYIKSQNWDEVAHVAADGTVYAKSQNWDEVAHVAADGRVYDKSQNWDEVGYIAEDGRVYAKSQNWDEVGYIAEDGRVYAKSQNWDEVAYVEDGSSKRLKGGAAAYILGLFN